MVTKKPKAKKKEAKHKFHLLLRSLIDDEDWDDPQLSMLHRDWEPDREGADLWSIRAQEALANGYNVIYIPDTVLIKIDEHYVADLAESDKHAKWLLLDDEEKGYPWDGDALIVDGSLTPKDFTFEITPMGY